MGSASSLCCGASLTQPPPPSPDSRPLLRRRKSRLKWRNPGGHLLCGRFALGRTTYRIVRTIGQGSHASVWICESVDGRAAPLALKFPRSADGTLRRETEALKCLGRSGGLFPAGMGAPVLRGRACVALSMHGPNLYQLQTSRGYTPFPRDFVAAAAQQLLAALDMLFRAGIIHADVKLQNIVLYEVSSADSRDVILDHSTSITLIDLGSCLNEESCNSVSPAKPLYVQSRWYRAPEVLLGAPLSCAIDTWSVGCVICELARGKPLLPGNSQLEQFRLVVHLVGPPPLDLLDQAIAARRQRHAYLAAAAEDDMGECTTTAAADACSAVIEEALLLLAQVDANANTAEHDLAKSLLIDESIDAGVAELLADLLVASPRLRASPEEALFRFDRHLRASEKFAPPDGN